MVISITVGEGTAWLVARGEFLSIRLGSGRHHTHVSWLGLCLPATRKFRPVEECGPAIVRKFLLLGNDNTLEGSRGGPRRRAVLVAPQK